MEPLSALAVATSTIQLVDYSYKWLASIIKVYRSIDSGGSPDMIEDLFIDSHRLHLSSMNMKGFLKPSKPGRQPTKSELEAFAVAEECLDFTVTLKEQ
ncbi:hypothetical protein V8F33_006118 [Rhypophila sp. PSN 637]